MSEETVKTIIEEDPKLTINKFIKEMCGPHSYLTDLAVTIKILCVIPIVGAFEDEISKFFGYSGGKDIQLRRLFKKAVEVGIIEPIDSESFYFHVKWADKDVDKNDMSISIMLDAMCITGELKRTKADDDYIYENINKFDGRSTWRNKYVSFTEI